MNAQVLFHPQLKLIDAARIARELGGDLVFRAGRVRIRAAMRHTDRAADAVGGGGLRGGAVPFARGA